MADKNQENDLQKQLEENTNQLKRLQAEFENHIKRNEKEKSIIIELANANLIKKLLPVVDDFENTVKHVKDEGVLMVFNNLMKVLREEGLKEINEKSLDPFKHEVVLQQPSKQSEETIIKEIQKGFMFKDKVIRCSKVIVAKNDKEAN